MELVIEKNETLKLQKVYCTEGHYITTFDEETQDITDFIATKIIYCPLSIDVENTYHCITDDEYDDFIQRQEDAMEVDEYVDTEQDEDIPEE